MTKQESRRTQFCFTYNNYTEDGEASLKYWLQEHCKYAIFGHEVGESGTPHLQGYFSLKEKKRTSSIQKELKANDINLALIYAKGSAKQNRDYCTKDGKEIFEHGNVKDAGKGARNDLKTVVQTLKEKTITETAIEHPEMFVKYNKGLKELKFQYQKNDYGTKSRPMHTTVYYGDGGLGKTRTARDDTMAEGKRVYMVPYPSGHQLWFDGYDGEEVIIFDDFKGWVKPQELFRYLDMYPLQLPIKGGFVWASYTQVIITSNHGIDDWYSEDVMKKINRQAYDRRFHKIVFFMKERGIVTKTVEKDIPGFEPT